MDDIFAGGGSALFHDFTSEAYVDLLHIMPHYSDLPTPESYQILACSPAEAGFRFQVQLITPSRNVDLQMYMQLKGADGQWKVSAIKVPGVRD